MLPFLVNVLFTFYVQDVLKLKNKFGSLRVKVVNNFFENVAKFKLIGRNRSKFYCIEEVRSFEFAQRVLNCKVK